MVATRASHWPSTPFFSEVGVPFLGVWIGRLSFRVQENTGTVSVPRQDTEVEPRLIKLNQRNPSRSFGERGRALSSHGDWTSKIWRQDGVQPRQSQKQNAVAQDPGKKQGRRDEESRPPDGGMKGAPRSKAWLKLLIGQGSGHGLDHGGDEATFACSLELLTHWYLSHTPLCHAMQHATHVSLHPVSRSGSNLDT